MWIKRPETALCLKHCVLSSSIVFHATALKTYDFNGLMTSVVACRAESLVVTWTSIRMLQSLCHTALVANLCMALPILLLHSQHGVATANVAASPIHVPTSMHTSRAAGGSVAGGDDVVHGDHKVLQYSHLCSGCHVDCCVALIAVCCVPMCVAALTRHIAPLKKVLERSVLVVVPTVLQRPAPAGAAHESLVCVRLLLGPLQGALHLSLIHI